MISRTMLSTITLFTFFALKCCAQTVITIPNEFVETDPPNVGTDQWFPLNRSRNEFEVSIINGQLVIKSFVAGNKISRVEILKRIF